MAHDELDDILADLDPEPQPRSSGDALDDLDLLLDEPIDTSTPAASPADDPFVAPASPADDPFAAPASPAGDPFADLDSWMSSTDEAPATVPVEPAPAFQPEAYESEIPAAPTPDVAPAAAYQPETTLQPEPTFEPVFASEPAPTFEPLPEPSFEPLPEPSFDPLPEPSFEPLPEPSFEPLPEPSFDPAPVFEPEPAFEPEPMYEPTDEPPAPSSFEAPAAADNDAFDDFGDLFFEEDAPAAEEAAPIAMDQDAAFDDEMADLFENGEIEPAPRPEPADTPEAAAEASEAQFEQPLVDELELASEDEPFQPTFEPAGAANVEAMMDEPAFEAPAPDASLPQDELPAPAADDLDAWLSESPEPEMTPATDEESEPIELFSEDEEEEAAPAASVESDDELADEEAFGDLAAAVDAFEPPLDETAAVEQEIGSPSFASNEQTVDASPALDAEEDGETGDAAVPSELEDVAEAAPANDAIAEPPFDAFDQLLGDTAPEAQPAEMPSAEIPDLDEDLFSAEHLDIRETVRAEGPADDQDDFDPLAGLELEEGVAPVEDTSLRDLHMGSEETNLESHLAGEDEDVLNVPDVIIMDADELAAREAAKHVKPPKPPKPPSRLYKASAPLRNFWNGPLGWGQIDATSNHAYVLGKVALRGALTVLLPLVILAGIALPTLAGSAFSSTTFAADGSTLAWTRGLVEYPARSREVDTNGGEVIDNTVLNDLRLRYTQFWAHYIPVAEQDAEFETITPFVTAAFAPTLENGLNDLFSRGYRYEIRGAVMSLSQVSFGQITPNSSPTYAEVHGDGDFYVWVINAGGDLISGPHVYNGVDMVLLRGTDGGWQVNSIEYHPLTGVPAEELPATPENAPLFGPQGEILAQGPAGGPALDPDAIDPAAIDDYNPDSGSYKEQHSVNPPAVDPNYVPPSNQPEGDDGDVITPGG